MRHLPGAPTVDESEQAHGWVKIQNEMEIAMPRATLIPSLLIGATIAGLAAAPAGAATDEEPQFVGTPSVRYVAVGEGDERFNSLGAVVRLDRSIVASRTGFPTAPELSTGDDITGSVFGGDPPSRIGDSSKHCWVAELQRPRPVATPRQGARWRLGVTTSQTVRDTVGVTLKSPAESGWELQAADRLGCYGTESSDADDDLVGRRVRVKDSVEQLLINKRPNEEFIGSLSAGQTFKIRRLSPSGKYAYGFGYGTANKTGWVTTSDLEQP
ncbi:MAG: hypothetical protein MSC31_12990 [Solirubrobacteraceae bacterium MAG38_C4-C5]|nr:hypothetical protein [Candidatus Siliceabacter maunaloa]